VKFSTLYETAFTILDPVHIKGVLVNLIDNSLKYNSENAEILIDLEKTNKDWIVNIADNGPGILPEYQDKIFDKFFRVPSGDTHSIKGYGLGLNYAKLIMEQHKGSIEYKNRPEGGSIFTLHIPGELV
jgi:two-component system phosphate regulon sensor histidine kinase PhoR